MAQYRIPLQASGAYPRFTVYLSGRTLEFRLRWLTLYGFLAVDIYEDGQPITLGRGLNPGVNLLAGLNTGLGAITLEGGAPTLSNIGTANQLVYDDGR